MIDASGTRRAVVELAGHAPRERHELAHRVGGHVLAHDERERADRDRRHRNEAQGIVAGILRGRGDRRERRCDEEKRVAVGGGGRGFRCADRAAGASPVLDDDRDLHGLAELLRDDARDGVGAGAGREGNDEAYRLGRVRRPAANAEARGHGGRDREQPEQVGGDVHCSHVCPRLKNSRRARMLSTRDEQHAQVRRVVDEVQSLAVDDEQRSVVVLVEIARVGIGQPGQVLVRDRLLEAHAAHAHPREQCIDRSLQIDDKVGRRRLRLQVPVDLVVERVLVVRQVEVREQRVLVEQEVRDRRLAEHVHLREAAQLVDALEQERELRGQRETLHVVVEARQERVVLRLLEQHVGATDGPRAGARGSSCRRRSGPRRRCSGTARCPCVCLTADDAFACARCAGRAPRASVDARARDRGW